MRKCCVNGCKNPEGNLGNISLHGLFVKGKFMDDWLDAIQLLNKQSIDKASSRDAKICSQHFAKKYVLDYGGHNRITPGALPTIFPELARGEIEYVECVPSLPLDLKGDTNSNTLNIVAPVERPSCSSYTVLAKGTLEETLAVKRLYHRSSGDIDVKHVVTRRPIRKLSEHFSKTLKEKNLTIKNMQRQIRRRNLKIKHLKSLVKKLINR